ncbi:DsbA family protein [Streptosporangium lutulentum]
MSLLRTGGSRRPRAARQLRRRPLRLAAPAAQRRPPERAAGRRGVRGGGRTGAFWEMHDRLLEDQGDLGVRDLLRHAAELGLDTERFHRDLREHLGTARIAEDVDSADLSGVSGTPTFFLNGQRHRGAYDIATLSAAVRAAHARAAIRS